MGNCSISTLFTFLQNADGIKINQFISFIYTPEGDDDQALGGSNITIQCADGYQNVGGSLTIVCTQANSWTPFPDCISNSTSTTVATPVRCPVTKTTWRFTPGYISKTSDVTVYNDNTAIGNIELD